MKAGRGVGVRSGRSTERCIGCGIETMECKKRLKVRNACMKDVTVLVQSFVASGISLVERIYGVMEEDERAGWEGRRGRGKEEGGGCDKGQVEGREAVGREA